jgi:hypothetical protein
MRTAAKAAATFNIASGSTRFSAAAMHGPPGIENLRRFDTTLASIGKKIARAAIFA